MKKVSPNGNMYSFVTHTWNPVRGKCGYGCHYCYVGKWGTKQSPIHLDEKVLREDLGSGNYIFVCSGCDLFHPDVPEIWIKKVIERTYAGFHNKYLFHTKNPERAVALWEEGHFSELGSVLCVTVESNIPWPGISKAPQPYDRICWLGQWPSDRMITVEPVMDFDVMTFSEMILSCEPFQVNIGADSCGNGLIEPSRAKLNDLIAALKPYTKIHLKPNLRRLLPEHELYGRVCHG